MNFLERMNKFDCRPPEINTASFLFSFRILVPLLAKQASPLSAMGNFSSGIPCHELPPSKSSGDKEFYD
jgi:hypothetical protein